MYKTQVRTAHKCHEQTGSGYRLASLLEARVALPRACAVKLSKSVQREMQRKAAEEFFSRRNRPETQIRLAPWMPTPKESKSQTTAQVDLPQPGSTLNVEQSKELLRRLASGEIKQVRRR